MSMGMSLSMGCYQRITQTQSLVRGGATETCFPLASKVLNSTRVQKALRVIGHREDMDRYRSMLDFVFCEIFTDYKPACFLFYEDKGPRLKKMVGAKDLAECDVLLVNVLNAAVHWADEWPAGNWKLFRGALTSPALYATETR